MNILTEQFQSDSLADTDMRRVFGAHGPDLQTEQQSYWNTDFGIHSARQKQQYGESQGHGPNYKLYPLFW